MPTDTSVERLKQSRVLCKVTFTQEEFAKAQDEALQKLAGEVQLKGFRPGKAPPDMVRQRVNEETLFEESIRSLLKDVLPVLINTEKLQPIMAPRVEAVSRDPLTLHITFIEAPTVKIKGADSIKIPSKAHDIDPKDVEKVLTSVRAEHRTVKPVERATAKGDQILIDFSATDHEGKDIAGMTAQQYPVTIGDAQLLPGFEDQLIGLKEGDSKTFSITIPEKHQAEQLRGKPVTFAVSVKRVEEVSLPALDDAFAKEKLGAESAAAFRTMIEQSIRQQEEQFDRIRRERELLDEVTKRTDVDLPPELVDEETRNIFTEWNERLTQQGLTVEEWMKREKKEPKDVEEDLRTQATDRLKLRFGMAKLIEERKIAPTDAEVQSALQEFLQSVPDERRAEAMEHIKPGTQEFQEIQWRATVNKLVDTILAA